MLMLKALRHRPIRRLWAGQALSSIGDEIYRVGLTWIAVGLIGADTGYLNSAQAAALMVLSFVGGKWADNWDPLRTMIRVDLVRAVIVLIPVFYSFFAPINLWVLAVTAVVLSGLGAFFDPALQSVLPKFSPSAEILQSTNGLMMTTIRMARMVGPGLISIVSGFVPPIHFFTMDAVSFVFSSESVRPLQKMEPGKFVRRPPRRIPFSEAITSGFLLFKGKKAIKFMMYMKSATTGTWNLAYGLGFALLVQQLAPNDTRSFASVIAAYGVGNLAGALFIGNRLRPRPAYLMFIGYMWMGFGFILTSQAPTIPWLMFIVGVSGFSGTMGEVTFFDLLQKNYAVGDIARIFRLRMALDTTFTLVLMLISPMLFRVFGVRAIIAAAGVSSLLAGALGMLRYQKQLDSPVLKS